MTTLHNDITVISGNYFNKLFTVKQITCDFQTKASNFKYNCCYLNSRRELQSTKNRQILSNGTLVINSVSGSDAANYTCHAENIYGTDKITMSIYVRGRQSLPTNILRVFGREELNFTKIIIKYS